MPVRDHLLRALEADLIGPFDPAVPDEVLPSPPTRWYLTGFLVPSTGTRIAADEPPDDEMGAGPDKDDPEVRDTDPAPKPRAFLPSSVGVSVVLPDGPATDVVDVEVGWADYARVELGKEDGKKKAESGYARRPCGPVTVPVPLDGKRLRKGVAVPGAGGLQLTGKLEVMKGAGRDLPARVLSLFLVNQRPVEVATDMKERESKTAFQVSMALRFAAGVLARPNRSGERGPDFDDLTSDLQFRSRCEYGVGHGVAVEPIGPEEGGRVPGVRIAWIPQAEVPVVVTHEDKLVETDMEVIASFPSGAALGAALRPLAAAYATWIGEQRGVALAGKRADTRDQLMNHADRARGRILGGIARLESDEVARRAFQLANCAMAMQARKVRPSETPRWRMFQIAFVLQSIEGVVDDQHPDRQIVDLIFFPTGGGKTEAYLGVTAFTLLLRRLKRRALPDAGLGVAVVLRYTLRLLTLDQLARAARLICALELLRREDPASLGDVRFSIGLWVGRSATANTFAEVKRKIEEYRASVAAQPRSPFPLTKCPWCDTPLDKESLRLVPRDKPADVIASCPNRRECPFGAGSAEGLPVLFVDEQVYGELPSFLLATVDKFAMLPWRGETGLLFGRATARKDRRFFGPMDSPPKGATALPAGLAPPELIVQDELHLISGPLGTMVGLYETAIDALSSRTAGQGAAQKRHVPKILASTATVRRAREQVRALFGRGTALFPPPGVDEGETFFAKVDRTSPGRLYVGVAASGRPLKQILIRAYVALLGASIHKHDDNGAPDQSADGYMTVVGYFNSLRELGGMRRLADDDVRHRLERIEERKPIGYPGVHPWARRRDLRETVELTSREGTSKIAESKSRLETSWSSARRVDVLLASNMISVGVDIDRLGVMVVAGQPKTTSEYIQATSRVGRKRERWPGLVVTCFNTAKPRDRSQYEHFLAYHESFYRYVEAQSLTPFSGPALDRGLAGTLVAMSRLGDAALTPPSGLMDIEAHREFANRCADAIAARAAGFREGMSHAESERLRDDLRGRARSLLDAWQSIATSARSGEGRRSYSPYDKDRSAGKPVLFTVLDDDGTARSVDERRFAAPTSMRDVEPAAHLWVERRSLGGG